MALLSFASCGDNKNEKLTSSAGGLEQNDSGSDSDSSSCVAVNGKLPGTFSVSSTKQIHFLSGNLQYQASTGTWRFAKHQYDIIDSTNSNISSSYAGWIDLFGWGTSGWNSGVKSYQPYSASNSDSDYYPGGTYLYNFTGSANADWGIYNAISNGGNVAGQWRTLTRNEFSFLYNGRMNATSLRGWATVAGVTGYVFLPGDWTLPSGVKFTANSCGFTTNQYSADEWLVMENAGAVFLPAAGHRFGTKVSDVGAVGYYWSGTYNASSYVYYFNFTSSNVYASNFSCSLSGRSVRLVQE